MAGKVQNPDLWFYNARLRAGFRNADLLAQQLGVPKGTVYQWERGSAAPRPSFRPPWRLMPQMADALAVPLPDLVEALWREKAGDPCPCGCAGTKVFPENPAARTLAIELPCAKCGTKRIHKRWKQGRHRRLCPTCATSVERIEFTCVGYQDHDAHLHARTCPRTMQLRPSDVNARQRLKDNGLKSLFDVSAKTYQCNSCAGAGRLLAAKERELREVLAKKFPHTNVPKIRSREQRIKLLRDHPVEISPNFKPTREAQERGRQNFARNAAAGKTWPKMTKANLIRRWSGKALPKRIRFGLCIVCEKIAMTYGPEEPHFHWVCHQNWQTTPEGKSFQSLKVQGLEASLPPRKAQRPVTEESLKRSYSYAVKHYLAGKSYREVAKDDGVHFTSVKEQIEFLIKKLPAPNLVAARFRPSIELLVDANRKKLSPLKFPLQLRPD
jgi:DNA-binding XRE family transcriptional regulator